jgi:protein-tyrosine phosphatase
MNYTDLINARSHEVIAASLYGIDTIHLAMSDFTAPTFAELTCAMQILQRNKRVYFHCRRGKDRTGCVRCCYRVLFQGWEIERAINEMVELGHATFPYFWWRDHLRKYLKIMQAR